MARIQTGKPHTEEVLLQMPHLKFFTHKIFVMHFNGLCVKMLFGGTDTWK